MLELHNYQIEISENVKRILQKHIQFKKHQHESGGILLGQIKENCIYILKASIPNEFDNSSRFSFERNKKAAQVIINHEFENSSGKTIYLGEWHTHPENKPTPSVQDEKMIAGQFRLGILNEKFILLLIQGLENLYLSMHIDGEKYIVYV